MLCSLFNRIILILLCLNILVFCANGAKASNHNLPPYEQNTNAHRKKHYVDFKKYHNRQYEAEKRILASQLELEKKLEIAKISRKKNRVKDLKKINPLERKSNDLEEDGTKIALKKELRRYSKELELYLISSMWESAYFLSKDEEDQDFTEKLYSDQYVASLVEQAYGEDGGRLADSMYEKLLLEQGLDNDKEFNANDEPKRGAERIYRAE